MVFGLDKKKKSIYDEPPGGYSMPTLYQEPAPLKKPQRMGLNFMREEVDEGIERLKERDRKIAQLRQENKILEFEISKRQSLQREVDKQKKLRMIQQGELPRKGTSKGKGQQASAFPQVLQDAFFGATSSQTITKEVGTISRPVFDFSKNFYKNYEKNRPPQRTIQEGLSDVNKEYGFLGLGSPGESNSKNKKRFRGFFG